MKHYVLGFVFNKTKTQVLLVEKKRPEWQVGHWNGIGGKVEKDENLLEAMCRESKEETDIIFRFEHCLTFVCPGGTVFVFKAIWEGNHIPFSQQEDELLQMWDVYDLPNKIMANLLWIIPVCLSTIQFPLLVQQNTLGTE